MKISAYAIPGIVQTEQTIIGMVKTRTGVDILKKSRKREVVEARQIAMFLIKQQTSLSLNEIGQLFNKDHATVIYSIKTVKDAFKMDKRYREKYKELLTELNHN